MILKLHPVSAMQFSVEFSECSFLCLKIVPFRIGEAAFVLAVQALRTCSLTSSTGNPSTASCIIPREGFLKTVAFLAIPRKFTLLLLVPVSKSGDLSSELEESETGAAPDDPGKFDEEEALLAPSFLFFLAALDLDFFLLLLGFGCFQPLQLLFLHVLLEAAEFCLMPPPIAPPADAVTVLGTVSCLLAV